MLSRSIQIFIWGRARLRLAHVYIAEKLQGRRFDGFFLYAIVRRASMLVDALFYVCGACLVPWRREGIAQVSRHSPLKSNKACEKWGRDL